MVVRALLEEGWRSTEERTELKEKKRKNQSDKQPEEDFPPFPIIYPLLEESDLGFKNFFLQNSEDRRVDDKTRSDRVLRSNDEEGGRERGREIPSHVIELDSRTSPSPWSTKAARPSVASLRDDKSSVMSNVTGGRAPTINATLGLIVAQRFR